MVRIVIRRKNGMRDSRVVSMDDAPTVASQIVVSGNIVLRFEIVTARAAEGSLVFP